MIPAAVGGRHRALERDDERFHRAGQDAAGSGCTCPTATSGSSVDQDRNSSSYFQVQTYNQDVLVNYDDGNIGPVYNDQAKVKYMIDSYNTFGGDTGATN